MDFEEIVLWVATIGIGIVTIFLIVILPLIMFFGIPVNTGGGTHVGYITAVENVGMLFKTSTVYVKTNVQSSQEDKYCVQDDKVYKQLQDFAVSGKHVQVTYHTLFESGVIHCSNEDAVIDSVIEIK